MNLNGAQIHLLLNHIPVIGSLGILVVLLVGLVRGRDEIVRLALGLALLTAIVTIPVFRSGEPAESRIKHMPGVTEQWIAPHEDMAKLALGAMLLFGVISAFALGTARGGKALAGWVGPVALILALATSALMGVTAHRGGMVRHLELRPGFVPPASDEKAAAGPSGASRDSNAAHEPADGHESGH